MNQEEFIKYWKTEYREAYPINHELKWLYSDRWLLLPVLQYLLDSYSYPIGMN